MPASCWEAQQALWLGRLHLKSAADFLFLASCRDASFSDMRGLQDLDVQTLHGAPPPALSFLRPHLFPDHCQYPQALCESQ